MALLGPALTRRRLILRYGEYPGDPDLRRAIKRAARVKTTRTILRHGMRPRSRQSGMVVRFETDSPLEGAGFEPSVPHEGTHAH